MIFDEDVKFWRTIQAGELPENDSIPVLDLPPVGKAELVKIDTQEWLQAIERFREAKEILKAAEQLEVEAKETIQGLMGDISIVEGGGARVYWTLQNGRSTYDTKRLFKEHPELDPAKYRKQGAPFRTFRYYNLRGEE